MNAAPINKKITKAKKQLQNILEMIKQDADVSVNALQCLRVEDEMLELLREKPIILVNQMNIRMVHITLAINEAILAINEIDDHFKNPTPKKIKGRECPKCNDLRFRIQSTFGNRKYMLCKTCGYKETRIIDT